MFNFLRSLFFFFSYPGCDCCDHNVNYEALTRDEEVECQTMKGIVKKFIASLKEKKSRKTTQKHQTTTKKTCAWRCKQLYKKVWYMDKGKGFEVQTEEAPDAAEDTHKHSDPMRSAVRELLITMFADIVENDRKLAKQTMPIKQCFLVHLLSDLDSKGSFLNRYTHLPPQAFDMDFNLGLSFVSSWLQNSLTKMKASYSEGETNLQMPFCVLETTQAAANARARTLQRRYLDEKVGIATLDFEALQRGRLIASVEHAFDFLRVSRQGFVCRKKLLAWAESSEDSPSAYALRSAVLAVLEWQETGEDTGAESEVVEGDANKVDTAHSQEDESEEQWSKWADPSEKHDSGMTSRKASG